MKTHFLCVLIIITCFASSCGVVHESAFPIVDYDKKMFSNGEYTTLLSIYEMHDTVAEDSLKSGYSLLRGDVFARDALYEIYGVKNGKKFDLSDNCGDWPRLIIPTLGIDLQITDGVYHQIIPCGTYDVIIIAKEYYPIHLKWNFISQHIYSIDFYLGGTCVH